MTVRSSLLGPLGPIAIKICNLLLLLHTAWRLPTCLVRRWSGRGPQQLPSCHGYAGVGGVRTAQTLNRGPRQSPAKRVWWGEEEQESDMTDAHAWASGIERTLRRRRGLCPEARRASYSSFARRMKGPIFQEGVPRNRGSGGNDCERPPREGAHRKRPPGHFWFLFGQTKRNPPRRAEQKNHLTSFPVRWF